jgi:hypothetical protein
MRAVPASRRGSSPALAGSIELMEVRHQVDGTKRSRSDAGCADGHHQMKQCMRLEVRVRCEITESGPTALSADLRARRRQPI